MATNDYILGGGDGYAALGGGKLVNDTGAGVLVANAVMDFIEKGQDRGSRRRGPDQALGQ